MKINKFFAVCLAILMCSGFVSGCGHTADEKLETEKLSIVCTAFPQYDWVRQLTGEDNDRFDVKLLIEGGGDLHNYQPTAADIIEISASDLFIYVGGASDVWVEDVLEEAGNENMVTINLMEILGENIKVEEVVEGMQEDEHEDSDETEYDEHVWLSLKNARIFVEEISNTLCGMDSENAESYQDRCEAYLSELDDLDSEYSEAVQSAARNTLVFCDRFPFRYMTEDYGLDYYAAFAGCSAETEASFETIAFLTDKVNELGIPALLVVENSNEKIAQSVMNNSKDKNQQILVMNSLQSVSRDEIEGGFSYLSAMKDNLTVLKAALN